MSGFSCQSSMLTHIWIYFSRENQVVSCHLPKTWPDFMGRFLEIVLTFLKVLKPARILPPIQVLYLRSGGAKILILISFTANLCTSWSSRSPKPLHKVEPPERTILPKSALRRSISVRLIASTTIWWTPGYSRPIISGSKRISGARKRSGPIFFENY